MIFCWMQFFKFLFLFFFFWLYTCYWIFFLSFFKLINEFLLDEKFMIWDRILFFFFLSFYYLLLCWSTFVTRFPSLPSCTRRHRDSSQHHNPSKVNWPLKYKRVEGVLNQDGGPITISILKPPSYLNPAI